MSVWVSDIAADIYGWRTGDPIELPIENRPRMFSVAGIWRDYARLSGAIVIPRELYIELTADRLANDAVIWVAAGTSPAEVRRALRARLPEAPGVDIAATREVRAASLAIFDRTFAVTYALEVAAVLIGLFGISVSFSAQALARRREFGMLRHLGMTRRNIATMLGAEGLIVSALGAGAGLALGWVASLLHISLATLENHARAARLRVLPDPLGATRPYAQCWTFCHHSCCLAIEWVMWVGAGEPWPNEPATGMRTQTASGLRA